MSGSFDEATLMAIRMTIESDNTTANIPNKGEDRNGLACRASILKRPTLSNRPTFVFSASPCLIVYCFRNGALLSAK